MDEAAKSVEPQPQPQPHRGAVGPDVDPVHQQSNDPRLLGGEELVPKWLDPLQRQQHCVLRHIPRR